MTRREIETLVLSRHHDGKFAVAAERISADTVLLRVRESNGIDVVAAVSLAELRQLLAFAESR